MRSVVKGWRSSVWFGSMPTAKRVMVTAVAVALAVGGALPGVLRAHEDDGPPPVGGGAAGGPEYPLGRAKVALQDGSKRRVAFRGQWHGAMVSVDPRRTGALLRVNGGGSDEGDSGVIRLPARRWSVRGGKLRYRDARGAAGGITRIMLSGRKDGGTIRIAGGRENWRFRLDRSQSAVVVTLEIGETRWCTDFHAGDLKQRQGRKLRGRVREAPRTCACGAVADGTWEALQAVFARHGCTEAVCHGSSPGEGGLDLRPEAAYGSLVDVPSQILPGQQRVLPGDKDASLLWRKLAALTLGLGGVPGSPMPVSNAALSEDELRLVALWIYNGAPDSGVVPGTEAALGSCAPPPEPQKIPPPVSPAADEGVQLHGAAWQVPVSGEDEVCYATYYDFSDRVPDRFRTPCPPGRGQPGEECFYYNRAELVQDPNSHHSIPRVYIGRYDVTHPGFGTFTCHGGPQDGEPCAPKNLGVPAPAGADCGPGGGCAGTPITSVACLGYGPPDFAFGFDLAQSQNAPYIVISTEPRYVTQFPAGVVELIPVRGTMVWNSHAFNVTAEPTTNEQWLRLFFAPPEERRFLLQDFFDITDIFDADVPPFEQREYCRTFTFRQGTRLFELVSHTHKRGKLFRLWGPGVWPPCRTAKGDDCQPEAGTPILLTTNYADPDQVIFDPPLELDGDDPASRTLKFCALYDNGFSDPTSVKRLSTAPPGAMKCGASELRCLDGPQRGQACGGDDRRCDSTPGARDGRCDACPARGWVTADDEMFALIGSYYCPEGVDCKLPQLFPEFFPSGSLPGF